MKKKTHYLNKNKKTLDLISHISLQTVTAITEKKKQQILEERVCKINMERQLHTAFANPKTRGNADPDTSNGNLHLSPPLHSTKLYILHCFLFEFCEPRRERSQPQKLSKQNI